jgi:thiamine kinase-like enzyme
MTEADMKPNLLRIIDVIRTVHETMASHLRGSVNIFWVFHVLRDYVGLLKDQKQDLSQIEKLISTLEKLQAPLPIIAGHHDLLPANIIDDGKRLWLIDWEYGGFGTAMFDLANISANGSFDAQYDRLMLDHYFQGKDIEPLIKSFDAMKIASSLREMLWARISAHYLALPGIDYAAHELEFKMRADAAIAQFENKYGYSL